MNTNPILKGLEAIEGLKVTRNHWLSSKYNLWIEVPEYQQGAKQIVGEVNFWKRTYTTQYPPNFDAFLPDEPLAQRLAQVQRRVLSVLEQHGFTYQGLDEEIQQLAREGEIEVAATSRDVKSLGQIADELIRATYPPKTRRPPKPTQEDFHL